MLYYVSYYPGTYGTCLTHFINQHVNFYSTTARNMLETDELNSAYTIDKNLDIWPNNTENIDLNELKKYNLAVRSRPDLTNLENIDTLIEKKLLKLVMILPTPDIIKNISKRNTLINNQIYTHWNPKIIKNMLAEGKRLFKKFPDDVYLIDIVEVFQWSKHEGKNKYPKSYLAFCEFLNAPPRPTFNLDLKSISERVKFNAFKL